MQIDDAASILAGADFFEICTEEELRLLAFASERLRYPAGAAITAPGDVPAGAQVLVSGTISIQPEQGGDASIRAVSQSGAIFDTMSLLVERPRHVRVSAVTRVETLMVPRSAFMKLARQSPAFAARAADKIRNDLADFMSAVTPLGDRIKK